MNDETIWSIAMKSIPIDFAHGLVQGVTGVVALLLLLRFMDWTTGSRMSDHMTAMERDPKALAEYKKGRLIGCAIIIGLAVMK